MKNFFLSFNDFILPNIISNVFLIRLNKYILINYECSYLNLSLLNTLLSLFGLVFNSSKLLNYSFKYDAILKLIPTSVCFSLSLILLNYSLLLNTFGTFFCLQASATIVILVSNVYSTRKFSLKIFFSLVSINNKNPDSILIFFFFFFFQRFPFLVDMVYICFMTLI
jgi:hypothetical protein